ncbi:SAC3/GANP/Nin1/mts3/eIF-3 p25 family-domain-containing protein [Russula brevipes]|nr:SAC3/GANP/Nin1/mts3/eIF-3 p25 family-domain-containing protein [Russula brevipes]
MESLPTHTRQHSNPSGRRGTFKNKTWVSGDRSGSNIPSQAGYLGADALRWERGGARGLGRGRGRGKGRSPRPDVGSSQRAGDVSEVEDDAEAAMADGTDPDPVDEPVLETLEERERFYQELVRAREAEKKKAIAEGKMDDPLVPKRLDEAITMVGTCMDMCPRFERYRRERENNLFNWEVIPGTKRVDHKRAVKMYERAAGDKTLPSDLRPPPVLKRTLDYLFRDLLLREGFSPTFDFIRDRSRSVRNDFTMQHETGRLAMECHERCARFHILALHFERDRSGFSIALEEQQLMNTLQSLKEFYEDQRDRYESPNELEMRIYHRLVHIRDQRERHDDLPPPILSHPVFLLTTKFRQLVQAKSSPITKVSPLVVDEEGMLQFSGLAALLREQGNRAMVYLVACILERLFGKDTIEDIEVIRDGISIPDIIDGVIVDDGVVAADADAEPNDYDDEEAFLREDEPIVVEEPDEPTEPQQQVKQLKPSATEWLSNNFGVRPSPSVMLGPSSSTSAFGASIPASVSAPPSAPGSVPPAASVFANLKTTPNVFGNRSFGSGSAFGGSASTFGAPSSPFGSTSSVPNSSGKHSFSSVGPSTSAPIMANVGDQGTATSAFGLPFAKLTAPSTSPAPTTTTINAPPSSFTFPASQSVPPGFLSNMPDGGLKASSTPPTSTFAALQQKHDQPSAPVLDPKAPAFSPGRPFGMPSSTASVQAPTAKTFSPSSSSPAVATKPRGNTTPQQPPPPKMQPISLPGTPTARSFSPTTKQKSIQNLFGWPSVQSTSSPRYPEPTGDICERLVRVASLPVGLDPPFEVSPAPAELPTPASQPGPSQATAAAAEPLPSPKAMAKNGTSPLSPQDIEMASPTAAPMRNGKSKGKGKALAVDAEEDLEERASAFARTSALASERVLDAYTGQKTRKRQETRPRADAEPEVERPVRTRTRRRTDAELARRLKENHEQHERRWAPGTFLAALRKHRRVGVERVFSIPLVPGVASRSPGLIVFECSPLHGVDDEIEKKYRVVDDCARLREVIETCPEDRHFISSVLFILWGADESELLPDDLRLMAGDYETKGVIGSQATFSLSSTTRDLDEKFAQVLSSMDLDTTGGLVEILTRQEYLQLAIAPWKDFASDWVARCLTDGEADWVLFSRVFEALAKLMNTLSRHFTTRIDESAVSNPLPEIRLDGVKSSSELYDATFDFPVHASVSALCDLSVRCIEGSVKIDRAHDIEETKREVEGDVAEAAGQLRSVFLFHTRPKRPPPDDDDEASVLSMSPSSKRLKSTFNSFSTIDDLALSGSNELMPPPSSAVSPSTSVTTIVNEEKPQKVITVSMLRALSQSVLKKNRPRG